jgi:hypothetical protein
MHTRRNLTVLGMAAIAACVWGLASAETTASHSHATGSHSYAAASGAAYRNGNFESDNWCAWDLEQVTDGTSPTTCAHTFGTVANSGHSKARIVRTPTRDSTSRYAARLQLDPKHGAGSTNDTAALIMMTGKGSLATGGEAYIGWSVYLPRRDACAFPGNYGDWNVIQELLQDPGRSRSPGPPFGVGLDTASWNGASSCKPRFYAQLAVDQTTGNPVHTPVGSPQRWEDSATVPWGTWVDFVIHYKVALNHTGIVELWRDGVRVLSLTNVRTEFTGWNTGLDTYAMLYGASAGTTRIGYFDDFRVGSSYAAVDPSGGRRTASTATPADVGASPGAPRLH